MKAARMVVGKNFIDTQLLSSYMNDQDNSLWLV